VNRHARPDLTRSSSRQLDRLMSRSEIAANTNDDASNDTSRVRAVEHRVRTFRKMLEVEMTVRVDELDTIMQTR
jgi:hypothetical protein